MQTTTQDYFACFVRNIRTFVIHSGCAKYNISDRLDGHCWIHGHRNLIEVCRQIKVFDNSQHYYRHKAKKSYDNILVQYTVGIDKGRLS